MKRALRRHQQRVAKLKLTWIASSHRWRRYDGEPSLAWELHWQSRNQIGRWVMNEPKCWRKEMHIRPSRSRANHRLKLVLNGREAESFLWPDYKKPHIYYW